MELENLVQDISSQQSRCCAEGEVQVQYASIATRKSAALLSCCACAWSNPACTRSGTVARRAAHRQQVSSGQRGRGAQHVGRRVAATAMARAVPAHALAACCGCGWPRYWSTGLLVVPMPARASAAATAGPHMRLGWAGRRRKGNRRRGYCSHVLASRGVTLNGNI